MKNFQILKVEVVKTHESGWRITTQQTVKVVKPDYRWYHFGIGKYDEVLDTIVYISKYGVFWYNEDTLEKLDSWDDRLLIDRLKGAIDRYKMTGQ